MSKTNTDDSDAELDRLIAKVNAEFDELVAGLSDDDFDELVATIDAEFASTLADLTNNTDEKGRTS